MSKFLTCCSFAVATLVVIATFITATNYIQLAVAIVLYPLVVCFAFKAFPRKVNRYTAKEPITATSQPKEEPLGQVESNKLENIGISDIDKRVFLKLIGGAGLSLFLFSIFFKKAEGVFFKSLPDSVSLQDTTGKKIDPAQNQPMDGYRISEIDDNIITFYGFTNKDGGWVVMKEDTESGSFRYTKGDSNFPGNWTNRENLRYEYFHDIF